MFGLKNPFKKEKTKNIIDSPSIEQSIALAEAAQPKSIESEKTKDDKEIEVLAAKIDALKFQYEALNEKINNIEKMVTEIYKIAKDSSQ